MNGKADVIELTMPFKAEYVSIARLTVSGIANRLGFDIETIEDIKVAVAEVCNKFVLKGSTIADNYRIVFKLIGNRLEIIFDCQDKSLKCLFDPKDNELEISIISALMDSVELCAANDYLLSMCKSCEGEK
jgi:serine/threonine-protein kinase RsbW